MAVTLQKSDKPFLLSRIRSFQEGVAALNKVGFFIEQTNRN